MRILLSGHGEDRYALDAARRAFAHRHLVLFTAKPGADDISALRAAEDLAGIGVEVHGIGATDFMGCLSRASEVLAREAQHEIHVHVAGGSNLITSALLLAAFQSGRQAFYCHARGVATLPVAVKAKFEDRISASDRAVLMALPSQGALALADIPTPGFEPATVKGALLRMRKVGLVAADAERAALTAAGRYYREHFARGGVRS